MSTYKVSFPSPNPVPGEDPYDTLDTAELANTKLNDESIKEFNEDKSIHIIKYDFKSRKTMPTNKEEIYIEATCESIESGFKPIQILDTQTFVDEVARGAYQRKTPDASSYIIEAKTKLKTEFANKLLENGSLAINSRYNSFGYIYSGEDKIGTFENISIVSDTEFIMDDSQSVVGLERSINLSVQVFIEKKHAFLISIDRMKDSNTAVLDSITRIPEVPEEILILKGKDEYSSEDDFLIARRALVNTNLVADNIENAFDDMGDIF